MASHTAERIRFFRNLRVLTQKGLGIAVGFPEKNADVRIAQYESGSRCPKEELTEKLAKTLEVSPAALDVPNISTSNNVMHTLFVLEDLYGFQIEEINGKIVLLLGDNASEDLQIAFASWLNKALMLRDGEIPREEYDNWRYNFSMNLTVDTFFGRKRNGKLIYVKQDLSSLPLFPRMTGE